jgi:iron complex transport system permease protein
MKRLTAVCGAWLLAALFLLAALSMLIGRSNSGPSIGLGADHIRNLILLEIRLPRTLLGIVVGGTLGMSGAALQGLLRNPLAEPGLLGASSGAALGAVVAFYFGLAGQALLWLPATAILGSLASLALLYFLVARNAQLLTVVLAGVAINALAAALTSLALNFAPSPYASLEILFWMLGSLADRSMDQVLLVLPFMLAGWAAIASTARGLDALTLGEHTAQSLGFPPRRTLWLVVSGTALAIGAAVAVTGVVGFVGLVVPHVLRRWVGSQPSRLLWPSFLAGAVLTLAADIVIRLMPPGPELKLGVVTALIGAPFFLHLILHNRRIAA